VLTATQKELKGMCKVTTQRWYNIWREKRTRQGRTNQRKCHQSPLKILLKR